MAHVVETTTTLTDFLKLRYRDSIIDTTPKHSVCLNFLQTKAGQQGYSGKSINLFVRYNSFGGAGTFAEGDALPVSLPGNYDLTTIPMAYHYFSASVSGQAIAMSADKLGAVISAWTNIIDVRQRAFEQQLNRELCGLGDAKLCQVDGNVSGQIITVDNAMGVSGQNDSDVNGAKFLTANMYVQARDSSGTAEDAGLKISSISTLSAFPSTSAAITVVGECANVANGSFLYNAGSATASNDSYGHEINGIDSLIDDEIGGTTTIQSISCLTNPEWVSQVGRGATAGTAEALTINRMMSVQNDITVKGNGKVDFMLTSPAVFMEYGALCDATNIKMNQEQYDAAWPTLAFMGKPVYQEPYALDKIYFIDTSSLAIYQPGPADWVTFPGQTDIIRQRAGASAGYDDFEAYWRWYMVLGIENRSKCGKLVDITVNNDFKL